MGSLYHAIFRQLHLKVEDLLDEVWQSVIDLQQRVEVAGVADVAQARWLILFADALVNARNWLVITVLISLQGNALLDGLLQQGIIHRLISKAYGHLAVLSSHSLLICSLLAHKQSSLHIVHTTHTGYSCSTGQSWLATSCASLWLWLVQCTGNTTREEDVYRRIDVTLAVHQGLLSLLLAESHTHNGLDSIGPRLWVSLGL